MTTLAAIARRGTPITVSEAETVLSNAIGVQNALAAWDVLAPLTVNFWVHDFAGLMQKFGESKLEFVKIYAKHTKPNLLLVRHIDDSSIQLAAWRACVEKRISMNKPVRSVKLAKIINDISKDANTRYHLLVQYAQVWPIEYCEDIMALFPEYCHNKIHALLQNVPAAQAPSRAAPTPSRAAATPSAAAAAAPTTIPALTTTGCTLQIAPNQLKGPAIFAARGENYVTRVNGFTNGSCGGAITSTTIRTNGITRGHKTIVPKRDALTLNGVTVRASTMRPTVTYSLGSETVVVLKEDGNLHVEGVIHDDTLHGGI